MKKLLIVLLTLVFLSSCAHVTNIERCVTEAPYGFWSGLLHGIIAPFSFIVSLFDKETAVYAINNNGGWYNFGFLLGASIIFGGAGASRRK